MINTTKKSDKNFLLKLLGLGSLGFCGVLLIICLQIFIYWIGFSFVASSIKALAGGCDNEYVIEKVLAANWFCPEKQD